MPLCAVSVEFFKQVEIKMLNHKNLQKNLGRTGDAAKWKIVGTSSWTISRRLKYVSVIQCANTLHHFTARGVIKR